MCMCAWVLLVVVVFVVHVSEVSCSTIDDEARMSVSSTSGIIFSLLLFIRMSILSVNIVCRISNHLLMRVFVTIHVVFARIWMQHI